MLAVVCVVVGAVVGAYISLPHLWCDVFFRMAAYSIDNAFNRQQWLCVH